MTQRLAIIGVFFAYVNGVAYSGSVKFESGIEPFLVRQIGGVNTVTYQNGSYVSSYFGQEEIHLWFPLAFLRIGNSWKLPFDNTHLDLVTGISSSAFPLRKSWVVPALNSNFSGDVTSPSRGDNQYWDTHGIDYALNNQERYLIEETSLAYLPFEMGFGKFWEPRQRMNVQLGAVMGISTIFISVQRNKLDGNPPGRFSSTERSMVHLSSLLRATMGLEYFSFEKISVFFHFDYGSVGNLANFQQGDTGSSVGYRFDGLHYNAKLGVSWKI